VARVLLIDEDTTTRAEIRDILRPTGHWFQCVVTGREGLRAIGDCDAQIVLISLALPDMPGIECLRHVRSHTPWIAGVILSRLPVFEAAKEALRIGASDWLDKPVRRDELLDAIKRVSTDHRHSAGGLQLRPEKPHAAARLAAAAVAFIEATEDAPTLERFGREVGHSLGCIRNWCSVAAMKSKSFCDFSRALRSVYRLQHRPTMKQTNVLEIVDRRTFKRFVARSGGRNFQLPLAVDDFIERQSFIEEPDFLIAVRRALKARMVGALPATASSESDPDVTESEQLLTIGDSG
jgi:DNA-binding NarL/FixJ family response regulator